MKTILGGVLVASLLVSPAFAQYDGSAAASEPQAAAPPSPAVERPHRVDPQADQVLKKMSELLARRQKLALEAEETFDEASDNAPRVQLTNQRRIGIERPGRFAADATGDTLNRAAWFDGETLSVLNKDENLFFTGPMPGTIDSVLDEVREKYDLVVPLSDFLYSDPYATLLEGVVYGEYLGLHRVEGTLCHHLAFSQDEIDWQIWIDAGELPLPRKLVISYVLEPGEPQYAAVIKRWSLDPKFPDDLFRFEAPEGARRIELAQMLAPAPPKPPAAESKKEDPR